MLKYNNISVRSNSREKPCGGLKDNETVWHHDICDTKMVKIGARRDIKQWIANSKELIVEPLNVGASAEVTNYIYEAVG